MFVFYYLDIPNFIIGIYCYWKTKGKYIIESEVVLNYYYYLFFKLLNFLLNKTYQNYKNMC